MECVSPGSRPRSNLWSLPRLSHVFSFLPFRRRLDEQIAHVWLCQLTESRKWRPQLNQGQSLLQVESSTNLAWNSLRIREGICIKIVLMWETSRVKKLQSALPGSHSRPIQDQVHTTGEVSNLTFAISGLPGASADQCRLPTQILLHCSSFHSSCT